MDGILIVFVAIFGAVMCALVRTASNAIQIEVEARVAMLPRALVWFVTQPLPPPRRLDRRREWLWELEVVQGQRKGLPITRWLLGMSFAIGLVPAAFDDWRLARREGPAAIGNVVSIGFADVQVIGGLGGQFAAIVRRVDHLALGGRVMSEYIVTAARGEPLDGSLFQRLIDAAHSGTLNQPGKRYVITLGNNTVFVQKRRTLIGEDDPDRREPRA